MQILRLKSFARLVKYTVTALRARSGADPNILERTSFIHVSDYDLFDYTFQAKYACGSGCHVSLIDSIDGAANIATL